MTEDTKKMILNFLFLAGILLLGTALGAGVVFTVNNPDFNVSVKLEARNVK